MTEGRDMKDKHLWNREGQCELLYQKEESRHLDTGDTEKLT